MKYSKPPKWKIEQHSRNHLVYFLPGRATRGKITHHIFHLQLTKINNMTFTANDLQHKNFYGLEVGILPTCLCLKELHPLAALSSRQLFCTCVVLRLHLKIIIIFFLFGAAPAAYGSSQARGWIRAAAARLHHSRSNVGSEPCLCSIPQLMATPNP